MINYIVYKILLGNKIIIIDGLGRKRTAVSNIQVKKGDCVSVQGNVVMNKSTKGEYKEFYV